MELNAMKATIHLGMFAAKRLDRETSREVCRQKNASDDAGKFYKCIVPEEFLQPIYRRQGIWRRRFASFGLPAGEQGTIILNGARFFEFTTAMDEERAAYKSAVETAANKWDAWMVNAATHLGDLYDPDEYVTGDMLREKFHHTITVKPLPDSSAFSEEIRAMVGDQYDAQLEAELLTAQKALYDRLLKPLAGAAAALADPEKIFRDNTLRKLGELADEAEKMCVVNDPALADVCDKLRDISKVIPDTLRKSEQKRAEYHDKATEAMKAIEDAMAGAF